MAAALGMENFEFYYPNPKVATAQEFRILPADKGIFLLFRTPEKTNEFWVKMRQVIAQNGEIWFVNKVFGYPTCLIISFKDEGGKTEITRILGALSQNVKLGMAGVFAYQKYAV